MSRFNNKEEAYYEIECLISDIQSYMKTRYSAYDQKGVDGLCTKLTDKCEEIRSIYHEIDYELKD